MQNSQNLDFMHETEEKTWFCAEFCNLGDVCDFFIVYGLRPDFEPRANFKTSFMAVLTSICFSWKTAIILDTIFSPPSTTTIFLCLFKTSKKTLDSTVKNFR